MKEPDSTSWTTQSAYSTNEKVSFTPTKDGKYTIRVKVKDEKGQTAAIDMYLNVTLLPLKNTSTLSADYVELGNQITVSCQSEGGLGTKQYAVLYQEPDSTTWKTLSAYSTKKRVLFTPTKEGKYTIRVKVKDEKGKVVTSSFTVDAEDMSKYTPASSFQYEENYFWSDELNDYVTTSISITGFRGKEKDVSIPTKINGYPVTEIACDAFSCQNLTSVVLPEGITRIGDSAFGSCENLTKAVLPDTLTQICDYAFSDCSQLTEIKIPDAVTYIGYRAFYNCESLTTINIPARVSKIKSQAFNRCRNLKAINVDSRNTFYSSVKGVLFNKTQTKLLTCPPKKTGEYVVPDTVKIICESAFSGCQKLTGVVLPDSVTLIGDCAFENCFNLTSVVLSAKLTEIRDYAFCWCSKLTGITLPGKLTTLGESVFLGCSELTSITLPNSAAKIGNALFMNCSKLKSVTLPDGIDRIGDSMFSGCESLTSIILPDSVTQIGESAFSCCYSLKKISIPNAVTSIGPSAFNDCQTITTISIPAGVSAIGEEAFAVCSNLKAIYVNKNNTAFSSANGVLFNKNKTKLILCPMKKSGKYVVPNTVRSISSLAFHMCRELTDIVLPDGLTTIANYTFISCDSLTNIVFPDSLVSIGEHSFEDCYSLKRVTIPANVKIIDSTAFNGCGGLAAITVDQNNETFSAKNGVLFNKNKTKLDNVSQRKRRLLYRSQNR